MINSKAIFYRRDPCALSIQYNVVLLKNEVTNLTTNKTSQS